MTLRARLTLGFLAIAVLLIIPLVISLFALQYVRERTFQIQNSDFSASLVLGRAARSLETVREKERVYPLFADSITGPPLRAAIDTLYYEADSLAQFGPEIAAPARELLATVDTLRHSVEEFGQALAANDTTWQDSVSRVLMRPMLDSTEAQLRRIGGMLESRSRRLAVEATRRADRANDATGYSLALVAVLAAAIAVMITRSVSGPVRELEAGMEAIAEGDFARPLAVSRAREDEFGRLAASYEEMARRLTALDKLKAEFVSVASHELKTPINVILGYLQLLDEGLYGPLASRQRDVVATLMTQGQGLARLVQQLLDVSRFEAGGGRLDPRDIDLRAFVAELESAFRVLAHQRSITFEQHLTDDLPETVAWDADRMNEVIGNLLSNAFKFTDRGGCVSLHVSRAAENVQLLVRDTGAGIPPAQLPHVFRKFYQADNQAAATLKGSGLGLAIAKEIVEAHGGQIVVDSTPGVGTQFTIELPIRTHVRRHAGTPA